MVVGEKLEDYLLKKLLKAENKEIREKWRRDEEWKK